jgi:hypothetical protein
MAWHEKLKRAYGNLMLAQRAAGLDQTRQEARLVRRLVRKTQDGTLGRPTSEPEDGAEAEEDDVGVRIGDEIHYHASPAAAGQSGAIRPAMKIAAVIAGLLGSAGLGLGLGALGRPAEPSPQIAPPAADGLQYDLRLSPDP